MRWDGGLPPAQALPAAWLAEGGRRVGGAGRDWLRSRVLVTRYNNMLYRGDELLDLTVDCEMPEVRPAGAASSAQTAHTDLLQPAAGRHRRCTVGIGQMREVRRIACRSRATTTCCTGWGWGSLLTAR